MNSMDAKLSLMNGMLGQVTPSLRLIAFKMGKSIKVVFVYKSDASDYDTECASEIATQLCADIDDGSMVDETVVKDDKLTWKDFPDYEIAFMMNEKLA